MVIKMEIKCKCGGALKKSHCPVEFFGMDLGVKSCEVCTKCNAEYLDEETLGEIEEEVKKRRLFGLEKEVTITKSGNSLVIRIPPEIVKYTGLSYKDIARIFPLDKKRLQIE